MKHTPGPWQVFGLGQGRDAVCRVDEGGVPLRPHVCELASGSPNGNLISASPELFEALEEIVLALEGEEKWELRVSLGIDSWIFSARETISKARGEPE